MSNILKKIIHLSDICQPNGVDINTDLLDGIPKTIPHLTLDWLIQTKPSPSAWKLWNKIIQKTSGIQAHNKLLPRLTLCKWITLYF